jgi:hypothetical protein
MKRSLAIRITERDPRAEEIAAAPTGCTAFATRCEIIATGFTETNATKDLFGIILPISKMLSSLGVSPTEGQQLITHAIAENIAESRAETAAENILTALNTPAS